MLTPRPDMNSKPNHAMQIQQVLHLVVKLGEAGNL